jgi:hypothetical protein
MPDTGQEMSLMAGSVDRVRYQVAVSDTLALTERARQGLTVRATACDEVFGGYARL